MTYKPDPMTTDLEDVFYVYQRDFENPADLCDFVFEVANRWRERMEHEASPEATHLLRVLESPEALDRGL